MTPQPPDKHQFRNCIGEAVTADLESQSTLIQQMLPQTPTTYTLRAEDVITLRAANYVETVKRLDLQPIGPNPRKGLSLKDKEKRRAKAKVSRAARHRSK